MSRDKEYRHIREDIQNRIANDIGAKQRESKVTERFNPQIMDDGRKWYESGFSIEEADDSLKNNINFIKGFEKAQRLQNVADEFFKKGMDAYLAGISWDDVSDVDKENVDFVQGYEEAMTMNLNKHR